jgi:hypothetical protein
MSSAVAMLDLRTALAGLTAAVDAVLAASVDQGSDGELVQNWQALEEQTRRLATADQAMFTQVESRQLPFEYGYASPATMARTVLRLGIGEARARVSAARSMGPRVAVNGEPLPPVFEHVAAAQAAGTISAHHARVITRTVNALPDAAQAEFGVATEKFLVEQAAIFDPDALATLGLRIRAHLDPDGALHDPERRHRARGFRIRRREDGSVVITGEGTAELGELLATGFDALAGPRPAVEGLKDTRTLEQRQHDALIELIRLAMRADQLPDAGGVSTTIVLTATAEDWAAGTGITRTGHGTLLDTDEAHRWACGDSRIIGVALERMRSITAYGECQRLFTENQRLALAARDGGCAFPGCDQPPQRCEAHHVTEYQHTQRTSVDNGCLLCRFHHREHQPMGWQSVMLNAIPHFIPPRWVDPDRKPQRNTLHRPGPELTLN